MQLLKTLLIVVRTPPRLIKEPQREVWFDMPAEGTPSMFELPCEATGEALEYDFTFATRFKNTLSALNGLKMANCY